MPKPLNPKVVSDSRMSAVKKINLGTLLLCLAGSLLSYYAYSVELKSAADRNYVALCDINEYMSCTKAFSSKYGKGFGIVAPIFGHKSILNQPNSFGGIFFYLISGVICIFDSNKALRIQISLAVLSNILSIYLASVLYFVLHDFCIVCVATYAINALNLFLSIMKWKRLKSMAQKEIVKEATG